MKRITITVLLIAISFSSFAQTFSPGFIVKTNGDTLNGYLQEELRADIVNTIKFKTDNSSSSIQTFTPQEVTAFRYGSGDLYKSISFKNTLSDSASSRTCYALQLVTGFYNLYCYIENEQTYFVVLGNNISNFLYNSVENTNGETKIEGNYISRLQLLAASCSERSLHSLEITYSEKEISSFVNKLNNCIAPNTSSTNYYQKAKTRMGVTFFAGGIVLGKNRSQFTADAALSITYPQLSKNLSINIGAHYSYTSHDDREKGFGSSVDLSVTKDEIFSIPLTVQYNLLRGIVQPFVYGGFAAAYLMEQSTYSVYSGIPGSTSSNKFGISAIGAVGIEGHFSKNFYVKAEWRYELLGQYPAIGLACNF